MEERLIFDIKDIVLRIVCQKCGTAYAVAPGEWSRSLGACATCPRDTWSPRATPQLDQLVQVLTNLAAQDQQQVGGFSVRFEVPLGAKRERWITPPLAAPGIP